MKKSLLIIGLALVAGAIIAQQITVVTTKVTTVQPLTISAAQMDGIIELVKSAGISANVPRILLEEGFARIPVFRLKPGADTAVFPGLLSIRNLPLVWDVAR